MDLPPASLLLLLLMGLTCPTASAQERFRLVEYNCENLFDTVHDSGKDDVAFLPVAPRRWNGYRYRQKLRHLSKVIMACGEGLLPDVVALCEVENDSCLHALTKRSLLRRAGYAYVMTSSPDRRGIDVALLYQPGTFRLLSHHCYRIPETTAVKYRPTRDILHVTGLVRTSDTLDILVCHLPSRVGGRKASEPFRLYAASVLKAKADSIAAARTHPKLILTGDFNDEPENRSLRSLAAGYELATKDITGAFHPKEVEGSYYYKGVWHRLDHILVNKAWCRERSSFRPVVPLRARLLDFAFLLEENSGHSALKPRGFYKGYRYNGGYSDHLPVSIDFVYE